MDVTTSDNHKSDYINSLDSVVIDSVNQTRDLGVIVDYKLKFSAHIALIVSKAKQRSALLFRAFLTRDTKFLIIAFKAYILPIVEYCSIIWSPHTVKDTLLIESIQRNFTKRLPGLQSLPYSDRLKSLNLISLELRRLHIDLIFCYKVINGFIAGSLDNFGLSFSNRKSRGNSCKLYVKVSRIDARKYFYAYRICEPWNHLPDDVVLVDNVRAFKRQLLSVDFSKFLIGQY